MLANDDAKVLNGRNDVKSDFGIGSVDKVGDSFVCNFTDEVDN